MAPSFVYGIVLDFFNIIDAVESVYIYGFQQTKNVFLIKGGFDDVSGIGLLL
jgi:hypothetical protein